MHLRGRLGRPCWRLHWREALLITILESVVYHCPYLLHRPRRCSYNMYHQRQLYIYAYNYSTPKARPHQTLLRAPRCLWYEHTHLLHILRSSYCSYRPKPVQLSQVEVTRDTRQTVYSNLVKGCKDVASKDSIIAHDRC